MCRCEDRVVQRLEQDFKLTLQQQNSLEQWAAWLDGVVSQVLKPYQQSPAFPKAAKLFLLKWSFYRWGAVSKNEFQVLPLLTFSESIFICVDRFDLVGSLFSSFELNVW